MSGMQSFDNTVTVPNIGTVAPVGAVGLDFPTSFPHFVSKWRKILLTVVITVASSDIFLWMRRAAGVSGDKTDDVWGLFQDMFGVIKLGKIGAAIPVGTYHFIIPDVGGFAGLYVQNSAGTVTATVSPIQEGRP